MRNHIVVVLEKGTELEFLADDSALMPSDEARAWLDRQFTALDCEPLRASGKVLTADKVLVVTQAAGPTFFADEAWVREYVRAVQGALRRPFVRVDVPAMAITY